MPGQSVGSKSTRCLIKYIALFLPSNSSSDSISYTKNLPEKTSNVAKKGRSIENPPGAMCLIGS